MTMRLLEAAPSLRDKLLLGLQILQAHITRRYLALKPMGP